MATLVVNGFDVGMLSNDEIFQRLKDMGVNVGPIVDSTRKVYERKLQRLLNKDTVNESSEECPEATITSSANHAGILKNTTFLDIPRNRSARRSVTILDTPLNNNFEGKTINVPATPLKKTNPLFITAFEVFIISFLLIVGYVFYQEVISFTQSEQEFKESNTHNVQDI